MSERLARTASLLAPLLVQALALWSSVAWYGRRLLRGTVEPWELAAFGAGVALAIAGAWRAAQESRSSARASWIAAAVGCSLWAVAFPSASELARATLAVAALACTASFGVLRGRALAPALCLGLLALPIVPVLDLHLGYPLRLLAAEASAGLLGWIAPAGESVVARGAAIDFGGQLVLVDEPCGGLRLLWTALFLASVLALFEQLKRGRAALLLGGAALVAVLGNIARTAALTALEVGAVPGLAVAPTSNLHEGIGTALAVFAAAFVVLAARVLAASAGAPQRAGGAA